MVRIEFFSKYLLLLTAVITVPEMKTSNKAAAAVTHLLKDILNVIMTQQWTHRATRSGNSDAVRRWRVA